MDRRTFAKSALTLVAGGLTATVIDAADNQKDKQNKKLWEIHRRQPDGTWIQVRMRELAMGDVFKIECIQGELLTPSGKPYFHKESGCWGINVDTVVE